MGSPLQRGLQVKESTLIKKKTAIAKMQALSLLTLIFSIIDTGITIPGKHYLIETGDVPDQDNIKGGLTSGIFPLESKEKLKDEPVAENSADYWDGIGTLNSALNILREGNKEWQQQQQNGQNTATETKLQQIG